MLFIARLASAANTGCPVFSNSLPKAIAAASPEVRAAYAVMEQPPRYELYDLQNDPHEFRNLAANPEHAAMLAELAQALTRWRQDTRDPLLDARNLERLTTEVTAVKSKSQGKQLTWGYPDYFFGKEPTAPTNRAKKRRKN